jgi:hypothetical protein
MRTRLISSVRPCENDLRIHRDFFDLYWSVNNFLEYKAMGLLW